jgi:hypothetical protein
MELEPLQLSDRYGLLGADLGHIERAVDETNVLLTVASNLILLL